VNLHAAIGRYLPIRLLGVENLGSVFLAKDPRLGREVEIKCLPDDATAAEEREAFEELLREEGLRAATLSHPHLTALLDAGEEGALGPFLVFEHVTAPTLRERVAQGPLPSAQVARLARELGGALTHIHDAGLVHRGVTPESVRLAQSGAKLGDFGRLGPPGPDADAYADEFALAATLYEALAGRPRSLTHDASVDPRVHVVFARALHRDNGQRFPSCRAFGEALAASIQESVPLVSLPSEATPVRLSTVPRETRKTQNMLAGTALAIILLLFFYGRHPDPVPEVALKKPAPAIDSHVLSSPHAHERKKDPAVASNASFNAGPGEDDAGGRDRGRAPDETRPAKLDQ
jgi:serine/threonine protein kinase